MDLASPAVSGTSVYANGLNVKTSLFDVLGEIIAIRFGHRAKQTNTLIAQNVVFLICFGARPTYCNHFAEVVKKVAKLSG